jgi:molybdopterin-binding protein
LRQKKQNVSIKCRRGQRIEVVGQEAYAVVKASDVMVAVDD